MNSKPDKKYKIRILPEEIIVDVREGMTVLEALRKSSISTFQAPCGGKGSCGKCLVRIEKGEMDRLTNAEREILTRDQIRSGLRLACYMEPERDITLTLAGTESSVILTEGHHYEGELSTDPKKYFIELDPPTIHDQKSDLDRIAESVSVSELIPRTSLLPLLPGFLRDASYTFTAVISGNRLISMEPGDTRYRNYSFAVDLGTTTIAVYLLDTVSGRQLGVCSELNNQGIYGADVISRISHTIENPEGTGELESCITGQIHGMMIRLAEECSVSKDSVYNCFIAGNTTMIHLMAGVPPIHIARSPYIPVFTQALTFDEERSNLKMSQFTNMSCTFLPGLSAYIGADILCGVLAVGMWRKEVLSLLIDIGTNGEIVLGNSHRMVSCAAAAGPAFEGAHLSCGTGGVEGAIQKIRLDVDDIKYTTILNSKATGICGSGIVDALSFLFRSGLIDNRGKFHPVNNMKGLVSEKILRRRVRIKNQEAFVIAEGSDTRTGESVYLTQKDIREIQLAKAAIAAGIETLLEHEGLHTKDIGTVYIAGGFGNYITRESAVTIGLIPAELEEKIFIAGNTAGTGAVMCALSLSARENCNYIRNKMDYLELSTDKKFPGRLMKHMYFPEDHPSYVSPEKQEENGSIQ